MPPKIIRIVNGEIREVDDEQPPARRGRSAPDDDGDDDGPRSAEDVVAQRLFGASASSPSGPTFDFTKPPLAVAWEDRERALAGLPGLSIFDAHLSSRWLVALAVATAALGAKGLLAAFAVWVLYKLGFEGEESRRSGGGGGGGGGPHRLGAHPHSGALPARALASYLAAAGGGRAATATAGAGAPATAAVTRTVGGSAGAASAKERDDSEDVRNATRNAWAAREAALAAAEAAAAEKSASKE